MSFPRKRESSFSKRDWIPAFAGMTNCFVGSAASGLPDAGVGANRCRKVMPMKSLLALSLFLLSATFATAADDQPVGETIRYESHGLSLVGFVYRPQGSGPFP